MRGCTAMALGLLLMLVTLHAAPVRQLAARDMAAVESGAGQ